MRQNKGSRNQKSDYGLYWQAEIEYKNAPRAVPRSFAFPRPLANHPGERYFDLLAKHTIFIPEICVKLPIDFFPKVCYNYYTKEREVHTL